MVRLFPLLLIICISLANTKTVAISYFDNTSGTEEYNPLSKGLADMLITDLSNVKSLKIVEREKLESLLKEIELGDGKFIDPNTAQKLGKGLGAGYMLTGSFLIMGETMRIDTRLVDVGTGEVTMAEEITGEKGTFFELEKILVNKLIATLNVDLSRSEQRKVKKVQTESFEAFNAYSSAIDALDNEKYDASKKLLEKATDLDEDFDVAWEKLDAIVDNLKNLLKMKEFNISSDVMSKIDNLTINDKTSCKEFSQMFSFYEKKLSQSLKFYRDGLLNPNPFNKELKTINDYIKELELFSNDFFKMIRYIEQKEFEKNLCDEYENNPSKTIGKFIFEIHYDLSALLELEVITSRELFLSGLNVDSILFSKAIDEFIIYHGEIYLKDFPYENTKEKIKYISDAINRKKNHEDIYDLAKWFIRNGGFVRSLLFPVGNGVRIDMSRTKEPIPERYGSGLFKIDEIDFALNQNIKCEELNRIKKIFMNTDTKLDLREIKTDFVGGCPEVLSIDDSEINMIDGIAYRKGEKNPFSGKYHKTVTLRKKISKHYNYVDTRQNKKTIKNGYSTRRWEPWELSNDIGKSFRTLYFNSEKGEFKDGKKEGIWEYQNHQEVLTHREILHSWVMLYARGNFSNGQKDGKWTIGSGSGRFGSVTNKEFIFSKGELRDFEYSKENSDYEKGNQIAQKYLKMHEEISNRDLHDAYNKTAPADKYPRSLVWDTKEAHSFLDSLSEAISLEKEIYKFFHLKETKCISEDLYGKILKRLLNDQKTIKNDKPIHIIYLYDNKIGQKIFREKPFNGIVFTSYGRGHFRMSEFECINGLMDGYYREWHEDRHRLFTKKKINKGLKVIGQYDKGLMIGEWSYFHSNGKKLAVGKYINGDGSNKSKLHPMIPKHGRDGEWKFWYESELEWMDGSLKEVSNYSNGKLNGISTLWFKNGQKNQEGTFKDGKEEGLWTFWYENGNILKEGELYRNKQDGRWIFYNEDGSMKEEKIYNWRDNK